MYLVAQNAGSYISRISSMLSKSFTTSRLLVSLHRLVISHVIDTDALDPERLARMLLLIGSDAVLALLTAQDPAQDSLLVGPCCFVISFDGVGKERLDRPA